VKLHSLEIQAFGPFANKEIINFSELGEHALFLIDGPTGAGKSSILHAVCYALYGETTDSDRKDLGLRCDYAEADLLTELSLEFTVKGSRYRITRIPTQMRPAKKGGGITEQKSTAHLRQILADNKEDTIVPKKTRDAGTKIEEIVGLSAQQFLQVMVLPQGKFRELLLAKSDDRQVILSTLFQTEIYKRIEQLLKDRSATIEKQYQAFEERKKDAYSEVSVADEEGLENKRVDVGRVLESKCLEKDKAAENKQQAVSDLKSAEILEGTFVSRDNKKNQLAINRLKAEEITADKKRVKQADQANSIAPKWHTLQTTQADITRKKSDINIKQLDQKKSDLAVEAAKQQVVLVTEEYKQRDELKKEQIKLSDYQTELAKYQTLKDTVVKTERAYKQALAEKNKLVTLDKSIEFELENLNTDIERLGLVSVNKSVIVEKKLLATTDYQQAIELGQARKGLDKVTAAYQTQQSKYDAAVALFVTLEKQANQVELLWFSNQAAVLAKKLEVDQACAVCGSLEHPQLASFPENSAPISQESVDQARQAQAKQLTRQAEIKDKLQGCAHEVSVKEAEIQKLALSLGDNVQKSTAEFKRILSNFQSQLVDIENQEKQLSVAKQEKSDKENIRAPIANKIQAIDQTLPELIAEKASAETQFQSANNLLPEQYRRTDSIQAAINITQQKIKILEDKFQKVNQDLASALDKQSSLKASLEELNKGLNELELSCLDQGEQWQLALDESEFASQAEFSGAVIESEVLEALKKVIQDYDDTLHRLQAELGLLEQQLKDKQRPDFEVLQETLKVVTEVFTVQEKEWADASQQYKRIIDTQKKVQKIAQQQAEIKQQYEVVGTLAKAASGRGNVRVSLERFVLGNILDQVLSIASQRLHIMSKGQYRLIRQNEENQKKNTSAGLDLAIDDAYTGKARPVATLSGGESFLASLALALGLSDVVQERSGGIQLDTLFIDEGFGSLDQEALQLAIGTLVDLQSTGRTIGIISHVSELKEQMAQRIKVIGSRAGSSIKVIA